MKLFYIIKNLFISVTYAQGSRGWNFPLLNNPNPENYELMDILTFIGNIIQIMMTFAGVVAIIYIIIGGYKYVLSGGSPDAQAEGKKTLFWAIAGLIIRIIW